MSIKLLKPLTSVVLALCLAAVAQAGDRHVLSTRTQTPEGWRRLDAVPANQHVGFTVALPQKNLEKLSEFLNAVSDPRSMRYGQYATAEEIQALTSPSAGVAERVQKALSPASCTSMGDFLKCSATAAQVCQIFGSNGNNSSGSDGYLDLTLNTFVHEETGVRRTGVLGSISVPVSIRNQVSFVAGLSNFVEPKRRSKVHEAAGTVSTQRSGDLYVTPETLRNLYNVSDSVAPGSEASIQASAEFGPENFNFSYHDLSGFASDAGLRINIAKVIGDAGMPGGQLSEEATLDVQYIGAMGNGNTNWYVKSPQWMYTFATDLINASAADRPGVISMSYGWSEAQQCKISNGGCKRLDVSNDDYVKRVNTEFQKLGAIGITLLASSGDSGSHGRTDEICLFNAKMHPAFPAASPYVTAVGGTVLVDTVASTTSKEPVCANGACASTGREVVCSKPLAEITSGGGFSNIASRPTYQDAVVKQYLSNSSALPRSNSIYNSAGRGYPDVSGLAHKYWIKVNGRDGAVDGTSASSPAVAGLVARINAHRLSKKRPPVGFLNPLLYAVYNETEGAAFNDIVEGNNRCTESGCICHTGFEAAPGWDASTGLGTPNLGRMLEAIDAMDERREQQQKTAMLVAEMAYSA